MNNTIPPGIVSELPVFTGDGYSYGGGFVVTFGDRSLLLGGLDPRGNVEMKTLQLARLIAAAPDLLALARQCASECAECEGTGVVRCFNPRRPAAQEHGAECADCTDIRQLIARAEGRS